MLDLASSLSTQACRTLLRRRAIIDCPGALPRKNALTFSSVACVTKGKPPIPADVLLE